MSSVNPVSSGSQGKPPLFSKTDLSTSAGTLRLKQYIDGIADDPAALQELVDGLLAGTETIDLTSSSGMLALQQFGGDEQAVAQLVTSIIDARPGPDGHIRISIP